MEEEKNNKKRVKPITLDKLPPGTDETLEAEFRKSRKERRTLPDTIENRELYRDIIQIAWPSLCELFLTSLVSMVDNMMVGNLGDWAISAVGLATQPRFIFMNLIMALNTGTTAMISRARGRQDREKADRILRQCMVLVTFIGVISAVVGYALSEPMVRFMANEGLVTSRLCRRPTSKSLGSWAGVIFTQPVPKSFSTYSSATMGISRPTRGRMQVLPTISL